MKYTTGKECQIPDLPLILEEYLGFKTDGRFVEVGAFDGDQWSNTIGLARIGWKGIAIEPHPIQYKKLIDHHADHDVTCIEVAIGDHEGVGELYLAGSLSTLIDGQVDIYRSLDWSNYLFPDDVKKYPVRVRSLNYILDRQRWKPDFDLLVIDVEGSELDVLRCFNINHWQPKMMIIETHEEYSERSLNWKGRVIGTMLDFFGYLKVYADTINSIYVREVR